MSVLQALKWAMVPFKKSRYRLYLLVHPEVYVQGRDFDSGIRYWAFFIFLADNSMASMLCISGKNNLMCYLCKREIKTFSGWAVDIKDVFSALLRISGVGKTIGAVE